MNFPSLRHLVPKECSSRTMTKKIAVSGLNFYLELAQKKNPDGIHVLFNEIYDGSVRVTRSKKIIESIVSKKKKSYLQLCDLMKCLQSQELLYTVCFVSLCEHSYLI